MMHQERLRDLTESYLKSLIAEVSGSLGSDFDSFAPFGELGIDSFYVLKIIKRLETDFGRLPKSLLFENFNINDLVNYFVARYEQNLLARFAGELPGEVVAKKAEPVRILERDAHTHPQWRELVQMLFSRYKSEGCVSRGTRKIAPNLFIGSERRGYFNYGRSKNIILVYGYTGPRDYLPALVEEMYRYCESNRFQLNILADEDIQSIGGIAFSATPFGAMQRIVNLKEFTLEGRAMRRLRYQVSKFQEAGACRTEEYQCGSNPETDNKIAGIIDKWCEAKTMVNPLVHDARRDILAGTLSSGHRLFLTYLNDVLQNVILITAISAEHNGYLMDLEFYPSEMPTGGLEFAIVRIIEVLLAEGCNGLSLGATFGCKLSSSANADPEIDRILDDLRRQNVFNDEGNLQFKNKFRPENKSIFLCRPAGSGNPDNVIDIIMMIADPEKMQTPDEEDHHLRKADRSSVLPAFSFNPPAVPHEHVEFDLKTDSWAQLQMPSIEAHMKHLHSQIQQPASVDDSLRAVFPFAYFVLTTSGQAAENIFFKAWPKKGVVPQNLLFPSTIFHQIDKGFTPAELPHPTIFQLNSQEPYKGNMAWDALQAQVAQDPAAIACVCIEVGNNASGGSPVSMQHLRNVKALLARHSIPLVIDGTRVVENAQFLIEQEEEYAGKSVWAVVREIFSCADAVIGSLTKDFCVNRGGVIATNDVKLFQRLPELVHEEGTGLDLIDKKLIALSLQNRRHIETNVLRRMENVRLIWRALKEHNVPVAHPAGGHCILIDVKQIPEFRDGKDSVASFLTWMVSNTGIQAGAHSVGMQKHTSINDLVRFAIPVGLKREQVDDVIERLVHVFDKEVNVSGSTVAPVPSAKPIVEEAIPARPRRTQDIAIVGMAGRYPKAKNSRELWENLAAGRDCIEDLPADRYERRLQHGSSKKYRGGFIDDVDKFDSLFFNISPREAEILDPQERLFLEVAWEAIEDAGYYPEILAEEDASRNIGVFVGAVWAMYQIIGVEEKHAGNPIAPNSFLWSIANRVSYWMNFSGPSLTVDTACSSSLTAMYLACEAIHAGQCSAAIVGGVNLDVHQAKLDINQNGGALSVDGVCRSFGKGANGYVAGEGIGALFLKPLDRAEQDGDHIYGVIKGAVVNHGGRTGGYTVPNPKAQTNLILAALEKANVSARSIGYIEAHGTGTELGDPLEITGLTEAFSADHVENQNCAIGSIKSNIGHLEAAAGVVSVAKVLLQMKHRQLVPSLHSSELNEYIDFEHSPFYVPQKLEDWTAKEVDGVRLHLRAGISSFGAGGANAHIILENYEPSQQGKEQPAQPAELIFPLSARNEDQLRETAVRLATFLQQNRVNLNDAAYTLQQGRKSFEHRLAIIARTNKELLEKLTCFINGKRTENIIIGHVKGTDGLMRLLNRREKQEFVQLLSQGRDPHKIAALWAEGLLTDWRGFQCLGAGKRISLPTYPFAGKRHWIGDPSTVRRVFQPAAGVHPFVDSNESTFERQLFKKTFSERDFFIYDHHVSGIPTLPGVAYLEFARKAGEIAAGRPVRKIQNILWVSPIAVENSVPREVFIELKPSGDSVQFEVFSNGTNNNKILHSQGRLLYATRQEAAAEAEYIDLEGVRARCPKRMDGKTAYPLFKSVGLNLGPSFQVLQEVHKSDKEALGVLRLPEFRRGDLQSMVLHPSLVDGSLQAGVAARLGDNAGEMLVPFSIGEVEILHPLEPNCFSYTTEAKDEKKESRLQKSNVLIVDEAGKILVRIRESTGVPLRDVYKKSENSAAEDGFSKLYYSYEWEKAPLGVQDGKQNSPQSLLIFDTGETLRDLYRGRSPQITLVQPGKSFEELAPQSYRINSRSKDDFTRLFERLVERNHPIENICFAWPIDDADLSPFLFVCQTIIKLKLESKIQLLYLYSAKPGEVQPHNEAVSGFVHTLHLEHPRLLCKTLEVRNQNGDCGEIVDAVASEFNARRQDATAVRYEARERYIRKLKAFDLEEATGSSPSQVRVLREKGVYLITGGAGGLGLIFAEFLANECKARLVLTGRSKLSGELEARLDELRKSGGEAVYLTADVSNPEDVRNLINETRSRLGEINGIIHSAGVLRDSYVKNKTPEEMSAVFAPKVYGTVHLDEATKNEALDFFVTFSSLAAVSGNAGQCDYSFANHFMDSFAAERERRRAEGARSGKTLSINWGPWADGGMKPDEQTDIYLRKTLGMKPLSTATGLDAFVRGLALRRTQFAVVEGVQQKLEQAWGGRKKNAEPVALASPASSKEDGDLRGRLQEDLSQIVMDFLKLDAADMSADKILLDLGFDSIGLTTFANTVNAKFHLDITPILFFDYPSIGEIAKYLAAERKSELLRFYRGSDQPSAKAGPPESKQTEAFAIRKGWDATGLDREAERPASGGLSRELRFVNEPIAIVGMSGVMPQSDDLDEFWENLENSKDLITVIPPDRWRWEDYYGDPLKEVNKSNSKWGGFMREVDKFDPLFFGISPREAQMMDPQQRIFLEHVWKAIEDSGQKVSDLSGTRTGLFVGVGTTDYSSLLVNHHVALDGYTASGNSHSVSANRISFLLNLRGPSAPIDTACSSSLVAFHRAVESIHTGSCDMAIVGGVQAMLSPAAYISFGMAGMLSPDGKCKTFDKQANGYVRGEGCGVVFLKRLSDAEADGNHIYAVIKATAENHGGRVTTMTAPNSAAQTELLIEAYEKAHIDPTTVGFIECHGTGTALGDPIEIQALSKAFAELYKRRNKAPATTPHCGLSSVKTNIGHLETGAGIAGVLKVLLAMKHRQIPANLHLQEINPYINLTGTPFYIAEKLTPWEAPVADDGAPLPRRAGVSSFGFGGANAHVVLEEYIPPGRPSPLAATEPQLIVLSAKNEDRLEAYIQSLYTYLEKHEVELIELAYTLQVGRDEMPERLALVVSSTEDLKQKLAAILQSGERPKDSYRNNVKNTRDVKFQAVAGLIESRELSRLAELWVAGAKIDWRLLYKTVVPSRISAPTYPFARERYWIPGGTDAVTEDRTQQSAIGAARLHPLIHRNISTLQEQKFASRFTGSEFFLADHSMRSHAVLPAVAYIEMVAAAGELSGEQKVRFIRNMVWLTPLTVEDGAKEVEVSLSAGKNEVEFVVRTSDKAHSIIHCRGKLAFPGSVSEPDALNIAHIQERCSEETIAGKDLYPFLCTSGLNLGKGFQVVQRVYAGNSECLAVLQLPEHLKKDADQFWLHPCLLDGAVHTAVGLVKKQKAEVPWSVPYSVAEVQMIRSLKDVYYAYATWDIDSIKDDKSLIKLQLHLLDRNGHVLVQIKDFIAKPLLQAKTQSNEKEAGAGLQSLLPVWNPVRFEASTRNVPPEETRILLLGGNRTQLDWVRKFYANSQLLELASVSSIDTIAKKLADCSFDQLLWVAPDANADAGCQSGADELIDQQEEGVLAVFRIIKALLHLGYATKKLQWTIITSRTQRVTEIEAIQPAHAGIVGLVGSLAKEYPQWDLRLLDLDSLASVSAAECLSLPWDKQGNAVAHRQNEWFQQELTLIAALPQATPAYRQNGVYVVIGGAGGVGEVWSRFMIEHYQANLVWIGRREYNAAIEEKINALSRLGPAPLYISADATKLDALDQACKTILNTYPGIHGVVHSAIVLHDQSLARMDESGFRAGLSAKVDTSVNMDRVFGRQELDFMLFFSSVISFSKSPGQSNYCAGCTFKDSFAHKLQLERAYPVKIMNWGYWGSVGVVAAQSYNDIMRSMGIGSIEPEEGMASLEALVSSGMRQMVLIKTLNGQATAGLSLSEAITYYPKTTLTILPHVQEALAQRMSVKPIAALKQERPTEEMTDFVAEILASSLMSMGLFSNGIQQISDLPLPKPPAPYFERWLSSSIRYLQQQKWLANDLTITRDARALADLWSEWEAKKSAWTTNPNLQAQMALLEVCLKALPWVISGKQRATDVMFPNSSMQLVERIYRGNALADYFNEVLRETLNCCIEEQLQADKNRRIRILEVGAGTGGTTAKLVPLLQRFPIDEYCYTDVSRAFLMHAEKHYQPRLPALTTAIFDVSRPVASQSIATDHYDVVIAANVLHATPNIRETLRNAKAVLKNQGVLLLNEISSWSLFNHLTFGLLEGWWLNEDAALRLPGSPGLAPDKWQEILVEEGFEGILFPAAEAHELGQQIIAACSNGWVRQRMSTKKAPAATNKARKETQSSRSAGLTEQMRSDYIQQVLIEKLSDALKIDAAMIRKDAPFAEYGVDSIIGVNLVRTINETLQIELETISLFEHSTVDQLAEHIRANWQNQIMGQPDQVQSTRTEFDADLKHRFTQDELPTRAGSRTTVGYEHESNKGNAGAEPIAIIGMSGRFAESESLEEFWQNLEQGKDLIGKVSRWATTDCVTSASEKYEYCTHGSFIDSIDRFDPSFFRISSAEALYMDPQQRLFLEESWKALEDAGYAGKSVQETRCGVYVGCAGSSNYTRFFATEPPAHAFWGNSDSIIPARVSYCLNLQGPAIAVDTACSSSLVSLHLACQGLWSREMDMALAGGVCLHATPGFYHVANRARMLSPEGKCYSFDARANGFVPGEGVGVVVLKRLSDALQDGDHIHGVIAGTGISQDGSSNGLIAPSARAQERLERSVYDRFKLNPETIQVVEAHGTGTLLGDSIEYGAISRAIREYTDKKQFCAIGTVKTNIGHTGGAAGIAGVLKLLLSLKHRQIPPSLHFQKGNPAIEFESSPFYVNTELTEWRVEPNQKRRAAVSSFGFSGTNAHVVIEEAPSIERTTVESPGYIIVLSARTSEHLKQQVQNLLAMLKGRPDLSLNDLSFTLFVGRLHLSHRLSCLARNQQELTRLLEQWSETGVASQVYTSEVQEGKTREQPTLKKFGNYCIQECRNSTNGASYLEYLATIADLYVQGYSLDFHALFSPDSRRIPLPSYPFARERYWIDTAPAPVSASTAAASTRIHPLLHTNTSTLREQSYSSVLTGTEFFLKDHQPATNGDVPQKVLPGAVYLEMARAAVEKAVSITDGPSIVELEDTVWGQPMAVAGNSQVTIALFANDNEEVSYEIYSGEAEQAIIHCQGRAVFSNRPAPGPLDIDQLLRQMQRGKLDADRLYAEFAEMGAHYGPAQRTITAVHQGQKQLLARLSLPAVVAESDADSRHSGYFLHPSLITGVLQAGVRLIADTVLHPGVAVLPHALKRLSVLAPCTGEMVAWVRHTPDAVPEDSLIKLDIELTDTKGNVCVQMRGLSFQAENPAVQLAVQPMWLFSREQPSTAGNGTAHNGSMGTAEKIELFLKQETALQLQTPMETIPIDQSYFDLGLTSLGLTQLIQKTNLLLDESLSPSALFEYRDIQSLAAYLATAYPTKIDALTVVVRGKENKAHLCEQQQIHAAHLTRLPRKKYFSPHAPSRADLSGEQALERVLWQEVSPDDNYEKVIF